MSKIPSFDLFKRTFTNGAGRRDRRFIERFGDVEFEAAYPIYVSQISVFFETKNRIDAFEKHLINLGVEPTFSNISESRYYYYNGMKYRFSAHVYPTGSMTNENCIDFAADPEEINKISF